MQWYKLNCPIRCLSNTRSETVAIFGANFINFNLQKDVPSYRIKEGHVRSCMNLASNLVYDTCINSMNW